MEKIIIEMNSLKLKWATKDTILECLKFNHSA